MTEFAIHTPATIANLGPGFDILGLAIDLHDDLTARVTDTKEVILGSGWKGELAIPQNNLIVTVYESVSKEVFGDVVGLELHTVSHIPIARGLGSSAAAIVSGAMLAYSVHGTTPDTQRIFQFAQQKEGHGDKVAAAVFGGVTIAAPGCEPERIDVDPLIEAVVFIPEMHGETTTARTLVPTQFSREDAIFNASRIALLIRAMALGEFTSLRTAMEDRWHQDARQAAYPWLPLLIAAANEAGALGTALSGAGPSVVALAIGNSETVATAMKECSLHHRLPGHTAIYHAVNEGARITEINEH